MWCEICRKGNAFFEKYDILGWQASTGMSSLGRLVGKGKGSIAVEAVMLRILPFAPPPIDSRSRTCLRWNDMGGWYRPFISVVAGFRKHVIPTLMRAVAWDLCFLRPSQSGRRSFGCPPPNFILPTFLRFPYVLLSLRHEKAGSHTDHCIGVDKLFRPGLSRLPCRRRDYYH